MENSWNALINCEIELILTWSRNCVILSTDIDDQIPTFTITETNLYVPVVTLSTQDNSKLLLQLKSGFKRTISWNKYLAKPELLAKNANLNRWRWLYNSFFIRLFLFQKILQNACSRFK